MRLHVWLNDEAARFSCFEDFQAEFDRLSRSTAEYTGLGGLGTQCVKNLQCR